MKLNIGIAKRGMREELHRVFIDFERRMAMISDGFVAAWKKLDEDCLQVGDVPVSTDIGTQAMVFKPVVSPADLVVHGLFDAELLKLAIEQMKIKLEENETADDRRVAVEIYKAKSNKGDGYVLAFAQERAASAVMSIVNGVPFTPWRPYAWPKDEDDDGQGVP